MSEVSSHQNGSKPCRHYVVGLDQLRVDSANAPGGSDIFYMPPGLPSLNGRAQTVRKARLGGMRAERDDIFYLPRALPPLGGEGRRRAPEARSAAEDQQEGCDIFYCPRELPAIAASPRNSTRQSAAESPDRTDNVVYLPPVPATTLIPATTPISGTSPCSARPPEAKGEQVRNRIRRNNSARMGSHCGTDATSDNISPTQLTPAEVMAASPEVLSGLRSRFIDHLSRACPGKAWKAWDAWDAWEAQAAPALEGREAEGREGLEKDGSRMWEAARKWMDENGYRGEALDSCDDDLNPDKPCPPPAAAESTPNRIRRSSPAPPMFLHPRFQPPRPPNPRDPFANMEGGLGTGYPGLHDVRQMTKSTSSSSFGIQTPEARGVEPRGLNKSGSAASCPGRDKKPIRRTNTVSFSTNTEKPVPDGVSAVSRASSVFNRGRAVDDAAVGSSNSMRSPEVTSDADSARSTDRSSCKIRRAATTGTKIGSPLNPCMRLRPPAVRSALTWLHSQLESPDDEEKESPEGGAAGPSKAGPQAEGRRRRVSRSPGERASEGEVEGGSGRSIKAMMRRAKQTVVVAPLSFV